MLRTSLRETTTEPIDGATAVIEADTAEAAIAKVHEQLGADARILDARRELRGGVGGFFSREVVQLHAAPASASSAFSDPAEADGGPVSSPVDRLLAEAPDAPETVDFATFLRSRMGDDAHLGDVEVEETPSAPAPASLLGSDDDPNIAAWRAAASMLGQAEAPAGGIVDPATGQVAGQVAAEVSAEPIEPATRASAPSPAPATPAPAPKTDTASEPTIEDAVAYEPGPSWSQERLLQLGMPTDLVRAVGLGPEEDDVAWTMALATELVALCGPIPVGPAMLVGPRAATLSQDVGGSTARSELWFDALKEGRWLHLVVGGDGWRDHLRSGPRVVSWSRQEDLPDALRCATELGLTLGYGPLGGVIRRARPVDVAVAVRELVDAR